MPAMCFTSDSQTWCLCPVIHSTEDEIIPFHHGDRNFQVANAPKKLVKLRGDHNGGFLDSLETYRRGIDDFVQKP
jgi:hypothetical protein